MFPDPERYYFLGRNGATSDDYDHACMTVEALCVCQGDVEVFGRELARRIKIWAACIPGGIGLATLRSSLKLWLGSGPQRSGVFSAGNGPAMRSHALGACLRDTQQLARFVRASTLITHSDPKAFTGAWVVALASRHSATAGKVDGAAFLQDVSALMDSVGGDPGFTRSLEETLQSVAHGEATHEFARRYGQRGVSGYIYHTVPAVIHAWLSHPEDLLPALKAVIRCGGDTDTTASILGGIIGARVGVARIPTPLVERLILWPRRLSGVEALSVAVANGSVPTIRTKVPAWQYLLRNAWFDPVVLLHGFRRLGPPY